MHQYTIYCTQLEENTLHTYLENKPPFNMSVDILPKYIN